MQHFTPHPYQQAAIDAILDKPSVALWMEMGLGKTVVTLTAIDTLIYDAAEIRRVLVVAPKKVAEATWQDEVQKWDHLQHLRISTVLGTEAQRIAALNTPADVYIINRENCYWLVGYYGRHWPFDMVVLDEASSFKNHAAQRFKALKAVRPKIAKVVELTGTPAPNNLLDLWAQIYLLDQGDRLGKYVTHYRQAYFWPIKHSWEAKDGAGDAIRRKISDLVLSFKAADLLELPEKIVEDVPVVLDAKAAAAYKTMEKKCLLQVDGEAITAQQAASLTNKLLQLCKLNMKAHIYTYNEPTISAGTVARTACLLLALTNQLLSALGKPMLPIESETVEQLVTAGITTVAALVAWWKNNSFTPAALEADKTFDRLKAQGK